ncbi:MAG: hypothetical protein NVS9B14_15130 [Candidatus Acidiferrum sp.]
MKVMKLAVICLCVAGIAAAKEHDYQKGTLLRMDSSSCGMQEKGGKSMAGEILGTDSQSKKTKELLCQEYILQSDHVVYRIRPTDEKHPALLPIGEVAEYRIHKDKLLLRVVEGDGKEREYVVVSMTPRQDKDVPAQSASKN